MADEKYNPLIACHDDLVRGLDPHVDCLVEKFSQMSLLTEDELANLRAQQDRVKYLLYVVNARKEQQNDSQCFDELIMFMKNRQDSCLSELADKIRITQDDDEVPCVPAVQSESSAVENRIMSTGVLETPQYGRQKSQALVASNVLSINNAMPSTTVHPKNEEDLLFDIIQKAENDNGLFKMRFSTVLCTGLAKTGKTSFCDLLMDKTAPSASPPAGNFHTTFIKRSMGSSSPEETKWRGIHLEELNKLIDGLSSRKSGSLQETWDVLFLLDICAPMPALCLLPDSVVTFVTYKMIGENFELNDPYKFIKDEKRYSKFLKEFLSSVCFGKKIKKSEFSQLKINTSYRKFNYIAFVGILDGSSSEESYAKEAKIVNESLHIIKEHINCTIRNFRLSFWYTQDNNQYLHLVNVTNKKEKHFEKVKSGLEDIVAKNSTYKVPVSWVLLNLKIQRFCIRNKTSVIEYTDVYEKLWRNACINSNEDELKLALRFFHSVGALSYFHSIKGMENFVFLDFRWLFDNIKYLHSTKDSTYQYDYNARLVLKYEGELLTSMINEIKFEQLGKVKLRDFINLLEHLRFVAPINRGNYFIPSVLDSHEGYNVFDHYGELKSSKPLLITLSSGSLHRSIFCYLTAHITDNLPPNWSKPNYNESSNRQHTFKDLVTFCVNMNNYICHVSILDKIFFLEIRLYSKSEGDYPADLYCTVFSFIEKSLKIVCSESLHLPSNDYKYGFLCCKCECKLKQHLMVIKDDSSDKTSAYCSKTDELEILEENHTLWFYKRSSSTHVHGQATADSDDVMTTDGNTIGHMNESLKSMSISQEASPITRNLYTQRLAVGSYRKFSQSLAPTSFGPKSFNHNPPALKHLQVFRKYIGDHWFDLGVELLDDRDVGELDTIKQNFPHNTKKCCTEMFQLWLSRCTSASWVDLIYALQAIELYHIADKVTQFYESNLRYSTPVDDYDKNAHLYYNHTSPADPLVYHRHRNSIGMSPGEAMELDRRRLDSVKEYATPKKK